MLKKNECDQRIGPVTRSSVEELDDWMVDTSAVEVSTTETRRLSVYPLEQLIRCDKKKDLLLLVAEQKDEQILGGLAKSIDLVQNNTWVTISG